MPLQSWAHGWRSTRKEWFLRRQGRHTFVRTQPNRREGSLRRHVSQARKREPQRRRMERCTCQKEVVSQRLVGGERPRVYADPARVGAQRQLVCCEELREDFGKDILLHHRLMPSVSRPSWSSMAGLLMPMCRWGGTTHPLPLRPVGVHTPTGSGFFLTNLPPRRGPRPVADLYRVCCEVERSITQDTSVHRLDQVEAERPSSVKTLLHASRIASMMTTLLAHAHHWATRPRGRGSLGRRRHCSPGA